MAYLIAAPIQVVVASSIPHRTSKNQTFLPCCRSGTFVYTNIGMDKAGGGIDKQLCDAGLDLMTCSEAIIQDLAAINPTQQKQA